MADDLFDEFLTGDSIDLLGRNFCIIENPKMKRTDMDFPVRDNSSIAAFILAGELECVVDMTVHRINETGLLIILPSQIVEKIYFSDDFKGYWCVMASSFLDNMPTSHMLPVIENVRKNGFYPLTGESLEAIENYFKMIQGTLRTDNKYKGEILRHLTIAHYYGLGTYIHDMEDAGGVVSRYEQISDRFIELVRENCHNRRDMDFYADALCLSAKHVSLAVRKVTGDNAMKWIERYTVLKAKSLLRTTSLSISEISDSLNFPAPSDFGKYFKKFTGMSPRAFRNAR